MKTSKTIQKACQILKKRVLFSPGEADFGEHTDLIRDQTKLYTETWVIPLLDAIEQGNTRSLQRMIHH